MQSKLQYISGDKKSNNDDEKEKLKNQINELQIKQNEIINLEKKKVEMSEKYKKKNELLHFDYKEHLALIIIENTQRELDGFYKTKENIIIKNKYSEFEIPANSYIIVEVKNNKKYVDICKNIRIKKSLLIKFGLDIKANNFYFIGILNDFDSEKYSEEFKELKEKENIIIITENDVKIEEKKIYVNYSQTDKDIDEIKLTIKKINDTLDNLIATLKPIIEDYNERKKTNKNN